MRDKISVVIPVYNVKDYLVKCIESVINQTHQNLEILLVNDGSTDGSEDICDQYALIDERIQVIHQQNGGLSNARNTAMEKSTGDYIVFLDSDDWIDTDMYEVLYNLLIKYEADISMCRYREVYNNHVVDESTDRIRVYNNLAALKAVLKTEDHLYLGHVVWNKLYKKELVENFRFIEGVLVEDVYFTPKVVYESKKCVYLDTAKHNYLCERPGSIMNAPINIKRVFDELEGYEEIIHFLNERQLEEHALIMKERFLRTLMNSHYQIKLSPIEDKDKFLKELEEKFKKSHYSEAKGWMSRGMRAKIALFELSPSYSILIRNVTNRVGGLIKRR